MPSTEQQVLNAILTPMRNLYAPPIGCENPALALGEYIRELVRYEPEVLQKAWESIRRGHEKRNWPLLAEVLKACIAATPKPQVTDQRSERFKLVGGIMRSSIGQQALGEGWGVSLYCDILDGRVQHSGQVEASHYRASLSRRRAEAERLKNSDHMLAPNLIKLSAAMDVKNAYLAEKYRNHSIAAE